VGNSFKIVPFLVWYARYRTRAGKEPVPLVGDLVPPRLLDGALFVHTAAICVLAAGALTAQLPLFHAGGVLLGGSGLALFGLLMSVVVRHPEARGAPIPAHGGIAQ
jgi:hypothetical protein